MLTMVSDVSLNYNSLKGSISSIGSTCSGRQLFELIKHLEPFEQNNHKPQTTNNCIQKQP
jgi:hypothetical protein